jgi:sensor histidine kinase YesM
VHACVFLPKDPGLKCITLDVIAFFVCFFISELKYYLECTSFPFGLVFTQGSFTEWTCKLSTCKLMLFETELERLSLLFVLLVLLFFVLVVLFFPVL